MNQRRKGDGDDDDEAEESKASSWILVMVLAVGWNLAVIQVPKQSDQAGLGLDAVGV